MSERERTKSVFRIRIKGSIDDVWREITKTDSPQGAFFNLRFDADRVAPGGQMRMRTVNGKYTGGAGEILIFDPPHQYEHTFRFTQYDDPECRISYVLQEIGDEVEFTLTCEDMPAGTRTEKQLNQGGDFICKTLKAIVEKGSIPWFTRLLYGFFRLMEPFSPKSTRSENWPL